MNTVAMPRTAAPPLTAGARAELAHDRLMRNRDRLMRNRERLSGWFEQDRRVRAERASGGWLMAALWPVLKGLGTQPVASLALGALAQGWRQRTPGTPRTPLETQALGAALAVVRRHPKASLSVAVIAGAALLWRRWQRSSPP